jgi:murein L,D-transpeptidase YcbB/YkuD
MVIVSGESDRAAVLPATRRNVEQIGKDLRLRQLPGPGNALGLVKFILPNAHDVYLHDTPAKGLFASTRRDLSHGCIRVSDPVALAVHLLRDQPAWTPERVRGAMQGEDNTRVDLARPAPVLIVYATAMAREDGEVLFYPDIYGLDDELDRLLSKGYPYPK